MPINHVTPGMFFPAVSHSKKWIVEQIGRQWLVLHRVSDSRYQVRGVFLLEIDARLYKRAVKKQCKKEARLRASQVNL